ncbi:hypothetical protein GCM10022393_22800 [Aquimarina addita]|uniref:Uncharacterized protein n=2 Tax=Aquimarina addita TaxID=870485 RepID=A0ABP6UK37_9FLAO
MIWEQEDGSWMVQIKTSLTAFQHEIKTNFPEYTTPEEFKEMVITHVKKNVSIIFNEDYPAIINKAYVQLGHETHVIFEISGVPEEIKSIVVKNSSFKDIGRNQNALIILKDGLNKKQFVLNNANTHTAELYIEGNKLFLQSTARQGGGILYYFGILVVVIGVISILIYYKLTSVKKVRFS